MNAKRCVLVFVVPLVAAGSLVSCGSSSSGAAAPNKTKFCADNSKIDKLPATAGATTPDKIFQVLKANQALIDDFGKTAPADFKTDAQFIMNTLDAAFKSNATTLPDLKGAGTRADAYCGQNSEGDPLGSSSTTGS